MLLDFWVAVFLEPPVADCSISCATPELTARPLESARPAWSTFPLLLLAPRALTGTLALIGAETPAPAATPMTCMLLDDWLAVLVPPPLPPAWRTDCTVSAFRAEPLAVASEFWATLPPLELADRALTGTFALTGADAAAPREIGRTCMLDAVWVEVLYVVARAAAPPKLRSAALVPMATRWRFMC
jgi:hypothetical protein